MVNLTETHGTHVNGKLIEGEQILSNGNIIGVAERNFRFESHTTASTVTSQVEQPVVDATSIKGTPTKALKESIAGTPMTTSRLAQAALTAAEAAAQSSSPTSRLTKTPTKVNHADSDKENVMPYYLQTQEQETSLVHASSLSLLMSEVTSNKDENNTIVLEEKDDFSPMIQDETPPTTTWPISSASRLSTPTKMTSEQTGQSGKVDAEITASPNLSPKIIRISEEVQEMEEEQESVINNAPESPRIEQSPMKTAFDNESNQMAFIIEEPDDRAQSPKAISFQEILASATPQKTNQDSVFQDDASSPFKVSSTPSKPKANTSNNANHDAMPTFLGVSCTPVPSPTSPSKRIIPTTTASAKKEAAANITDNTRKTSDILHHSPTVNPSFLGSPMRVPVSTKKQSALATLLSSPSKAAGLGSPQRININATKAHDQESLLLASPGRVYADPVVHDKPDCSIRHSPARVAISSSTVLESSLGPMSVESKEKESLVTNDPIQEEQSVTVEHEKEQEAPPTNNITQQESIMEQHDVTEHQAMIFEEWKTAFLEPAVEKIEEDSSKIFEQPTEQDPIHIQQQLVDSPISPLVTASPIRTNEAAGIKDCCSPQGINTPPSKASFNESPILTGIPTAETYSSPYTIHSPLQTITQAEIQKAAEEGTSIVEGETKMDEGIVVKKEPLPTINEQTGEILLDEQQHQENGTAKGAQEAKLNSAIEELQQTAILKNNPGEIENDINNNNVQTMNSADQNVVILCDYVATDAVAEPKEAVAVDTESLNLPVLTPAPDVEMTDAAQTQTTAQKQEDKEIKYVENQHPKEFNVQERDRAIKDFLITEPDEEPQQTEPEEKATEGKQIQEPFFQHKPQEQQETIHPVKPEAPASEQVKDETEKPAQKLAQEQLEIIEEQQLANEEPVQPAHGVQENTHQAPKRVHIEEPQEKEQESVIETNLVEEHQTPIKPGTPKSRGKTPRSGRYHPPTPMPTSRVASNDDEEQKDNADHQKENKKEYSNQDGEHGEGHQMSTRASARLAAKKTLTPVKAAASPKAIPGSVSKASPLIASLNSATTSRAQQRQLSEKRSLTDVEEGETPSPSKRRPTRHHK